MRRTCSPACSGIFSVFFSLENAQETKTENELLANTSPSPPQIKGGRRRVEEVVRVVGRTVSA